MTGISVTKIFDFEMAHALWNYEGVCKNIHGHSYKLYVTVKGIPVQDDAHPKFGMVIDFKDLKKIVTSSVIDQLDHALVLYKKAGGESIQALKKMYDKVHMVEFQPTCENLIIYIADTLKRLLPENTTLHSLKLYETANSYAEWHSDD